jgi:hypothetical protein
LNSSFVIGSVSLFQSSGAGVISVGGGHGFNAPSAGAAQERSITPDHSARVVNAVICVTRHSVEVKKAAAISKPSSFVFG